MPPKKSRGDFQVAAAAENAMSVSSFTPTNPPMSSNRSGKIPSVAPTSIRKPRGSDAQNRWMFKDTGAVIHTIPQETIEPAATAVSSASGFELLCSYNLMERPKDQPQILVPGAARRWHLPKLPVQLKADAGLDFIDQHAYRYPTRPFEPVFQAVAAMNPNVSFNDLDIICNRNSLTKLPDFVLGKRCDPFAIKLNMIGKTLFLARNEKKAKAYQTGGYGRAFEHFFTKNEDGLGGSTSHHRVIRYKLGDLNCAVRFEVDASYQSSDSVNPIRSTKLSSGAGNILSLQELEDALLGPQNPLPSAYVGSQTRAIPKGIGTDNSCVAEIKSGSKGRATFMPQLWFGRTPHLLKGKHTKGNFHSVDYTRTDQYFKE